LLIPCILQTIAIIGGQIQWLSSRLLNRLKLLKPSGFVIDFQQETSWSFGRIGND
jgi:hypothetical protein